MDECLSLLDEASLDPFSRRRLYVDDVGLGKLPCRTAFRGLLLWI